MLTGLALALAAACLTLLPGSPALAAVPAAAPVAAAPAVDYDALALQIAVEINNARMNPTGMADALEKLAPTLKGRGLHLPDGNVIQTDKAYLDQSIAEVRKQTVLKPLAWSPKLAKLSKDFVPTAARSMGHGNYGSRTTGIGGKGWIEAIAWEDPNALSHVYGHWISQADGWPRTTPPTSWRGHRGIVNDSAMTAIGVACGFSRMWVPDGVVCVINDGIDMPDESPLATPANRTPPLDKIDGPIEGSVGGTTTTPKVTVDLETPTEPTATASERSAATGGPLDEPSTDASPSPTTSPSADTSSAEPAPSESTDAPAADCAGADEAAATPAENAALLRCLIDQARAAAGLPAYTVNARADHYAGVAADGGRLPQFPADVCGKKFMAGEANGTSPEPTAQKAFGAIGGATSKWVTTTTETELGVGYSARNKRFGLYRASCK